METNQTDLYKLATTFVADCDAAILRRLEDAGLTLEDFFQLESHPLSEKLGLHRVISKADRDEALALARREMEFIGRHHIQMLHYGDADYPQRLSQCYDAPVNLFVLGDANLDSQHMLAVVGTRKATPYGDSCCRKAVETLAGWFRPELCIVSGLAYGCDKAAHEAALAAQTPTVAVLAHGLDMIYPAQHRGLASAIIANGGALITEFPAKTRPFRNNFLQRNRIVAGLCDATLVVESAVKGGAISTANLTFEYDRTLFAFPGRVNDPQSAGCNHLIRREKAHLCMGAEDIVDVMGWKPMGGLHATREIPELFQPEDRVQRHIYDTLRSSGGSMSVDQLHVAVGGKISELVAVLSEMEFDGMLVKLPGNRYSVD